MDSWKRRLKDYYPPEELITLSVYHTSLATSCDQDHHLVSKRKVAEAWVVSYNPYCLEAMRSNMAMELILYTPRRVLDYITKGNKDKMGEDEDQSQSRVQKLLEGLGGKDAKTIGDRANDMMLNPITDGAHTF